MEEETLKFVPLKSVIDAGFWESLTKKKLDEWKLDDSEKPITWSYTPGKSFIRLDFDALESSDSSATGTVRNFNTVEDFKKLDKKQYLADALAEIRNSIENEEDFRWEKLFLPKIIIFSDLKKYHYTFWFCFPTLKLSKPLVIRSSRAANHLELEQFQSNQSNENFFLIVENDRRPFRESTKLVTDEKIDPAKVIFCFEDHVQESTAPENAVGIMARNLIFFIWARLKLSTFKICSVRSTFKQENGLFTKDFSSSRVYEISLSSDICEVNGSGWEPFKDKLAPKKIDLSASMDSRQLAGNAVDLNLKLMKWRLQPEIDLDTIKEKKILLLGSGTLGCNVARALIGWGVRHITFVDNGKVSYSNPVRQSLFNFSDSENKVPKAEGAALALSLISPNVTSNGVKLSIPMPGHHIDLDTATQSVAELEKLITEHDVVYLLMDTRESRWLPTVIGKSQNKLVINAALGFDTFMVMRHGVAPVEDKNSEDSECSTPFKREIKPGARICHLGCYFCNDVVAPANSTTDRTLDQQCTVSRPGLSMIAAAYAVELMVSVFQHRDGVRAKAGVRPDDHEESCLGTVPHQIRGFLGQMHTILPTTEAFEQCTACSTKIIENYQQGGINFLMNVFNSSAGFLEDLTGLTELHAAAAEIEIFGFSSDDE